MPQLLIAGYGYVGEALGTRFVENGWQVNAWKRSHATGSGDKDIEIAALDFSDSEEVHRARFNADAVIHCASTRGGTVEQYQRVYVESAKNLAREFPRAKLVFTSSTSVYAQCNGELVNERSPAEPLTETGKILRNAEDIVLGAGGIVLRLGAIYGPKRSALLDSIIRGSATVAAPDRFVNQIHRDDVVSAIFHIIQDGGISPPPIFNVVDDHPAPRSEILRWLSRRIDIPLSRSDIPVATKRGKSNKRVSNAKLRAFGWRPIYPTYVEGFDRSVLPSYGLAPR